MSTTLFDFQVEAGRKLIHLLDEKQFPVTSAFWLYRSDPDRWRLILASTLVDELGARAAYRRLSDAMKGFEGLSLLHQISLVSPNDELVSLLKKAVQTGQGVNPIRFSKNLIGDRYVEDAVIYRST